MGILAFFAAFKEVLEFVLDIYNAAEIVEGFFNDPDAAARQRYESEMQAILAARDDLLQASQKVLGAVGDVQVTVFRQDMSDIFALIDTAESVYANAQVPTTDPVTAATLTALAIDHATLSLSTVLELTRQRAYPPEAVAFQAMQVLVRSMMVLKQAQPGFCTSATSTLVLGVIALLETAADNITKGLDAATPVRTQRKTLRQRVPASDGGTDFVFHITVTVTYRNLSGDISYASPPYAYISEDADDESNPPIVLGYIRDAEAVRANGLARDADNAGATSMRVTAESQRTALATCESMHIAQMIVGRPFTYVETGLYKLERRTKTMRDAAIAMIASPVVAASPARALPDDDPRALAAAVHEVFDRTLTDEENNALGVAAKAFGRPLAALMLLFDQAATKA